MFDADFRPSTPCIGVCILDERSGLCRGCFRSLSEIGAWGLMTERRRQEIMQRLEERKRYVSEDRT